MRFLLVFALLSIASAAFHVTITSESDWRFLKGNAIGGEKPQFDDSSWRKVSIPHDWSIEGPFDSKNPTGGAGAFLPAGVGWYRKHFGLTELLNKHRIYVDFDGVMANSDVWINGVHLGRRPSGYVSFRYELTGHVNFGSKGNVLAVRVDNSAEPASRWYAGAGIYRHVRFVAVDPVHIEHWSTFVSTPTISAASATVHVQTVVVNQSDSERQVGVKFTIGARGKSVGSSQVEPVAIAAGTTHLFEANIEVPSPRLWSLTDPELYSMGVAVSGDKASDSESVTFGIREARFDAATGFWLNGKNFKLKGVCLHQEVGGLGVAVPDSAWISRITALKAIGVNAIRTAHNPPSPDFLDLCDRMGMLVMDEMFDVWTVAKNPYDYHLFFREWSKIDTRDTVMRDRNHPSIVLYSAGNEIHDTPKAELAKEILRGLLDTFHEFDPTRPVTQALFRPNVSHDYEDGLADMLDVVGQNYRENEILKAHADKPTRKIVGTETQHDRRAWLALRDNAPFAGQFLWSGVDYLGESRRWPAVGAGSGLLDRTDALKPMGMERESWWSEKPVVHIARRVARAQATPDDPGFNPLARTQTVFADWTPANLSPHDEAVEVYSNCADVELWLNGVSLGNKPLNQDASARTWTVPFAAGSIRASGCGGTATEELRTAGKAAKIVLSTDGPVGTPLQRAWNSVAYLTAQVVDEMGVPVPDASDLIQFKVSGPGVIGAVDNGDLASHELFQTNARHAYQGRCVAIVRSNGNGAFTVTASANELEEGSIEINRVR